METFSTPEQLAERLQITTGTLAKWRLTGRGPRFRKFGSLVRYSTTDVATWLAESSQCSTADGADRRPRAGRKRASAPV